MVPGKDLLRACVASPRDTQFTQLSPDRQHACRNVTKSIAVIIVLAWGCHVYGQTVSPNGIRRVASTNSAGIHIASNHGFDGECHCPGCTAFREQCEQGILPPVIDEGGAWTPPELRQQPTPATPQPDSPYSTPDGTMGQGADTQIPSPESPFTNQMPSDSGQTASPLADSSSNNMSSGDGGAANQLASAFGGSADSYGAPSMIGDFFGGGYQLAVFDSEFGQTPVPVTIPSAGGDRRRKLADQGSPFPEDRVTFSYNHYRNAATDIFLQDVNVNRYMFGIEKTFLDRSTSIELRIPFVGGVSSQQSFTNTDTEGTEFGNLSATFKGLLYCRRTTAISAGMTAIFPTVDDVVLEGPPGFFDRITFDSGSVHLAPFLAAWHAPSARLFHQIIAQTDFDTGGYEVVINDQIRGTVQEQSLLYLDYSLGYWMYQNPYTTIRGIAPIFEVHYTTTMQDGDPGPRPGMFFDNRRDIYNVIGGLHFQFGRGTNLRVGGGSPLRQRADREFDAEFALQLTRFF